MGDELGAKNRCRLTQVGLEKLEKTLKQNRVSANTRLATMADMDADTIAKIRSPKQDQAVWYQKLVQCFDCLELRLSDEDYVMDVVVVPAVVVPGLNPFGAEGCITDPNRLWGRDELLRQLFEGLDRGGNRSLIGPEGTGKSSLLHAVSRLGAERMKDPPHKFIHLDLHLIRDGKTFWEVLCEELGLDGPLHGYHLGRALRGRRFVVCLDEIARMTDTARFSREDSEELRGLADGEHLPLSLVIAAQHPLGELFPDESGRTSPLAGICVGMEVSVFGVGEVRRFVADRLLGTGVEFKAEQLDQLWEVSQGNPKRLQRSAAELYDELLR
jgi:hypothetical protein